MMNNNISTKEIKDISNNFYYFFTATKILKIICLVGPMDNLVNQDMDIVCL
jgi:hypothetical protein